MTGPDRRNIKINVTVDSDTRGSEEAAKSLERVDTSAGHAEKGLADLKKESEHLDIQLAKSRLKVRELEQELVRTGDRTTGRGSLRSLVNQERAWLRELERLQQSARGVATNSGGGGFGLFSPQAIGGLAALVAAAAPSIGAIVSGAVAGTVAGGGIVGGIVAASTDTRVKSAFKDLTGEFTAEAFGGGAFVKPLVEGLHILQSDFRGLHLDEALSKGASSVTILAHGIGDLAKNLMPGFNAVMDKAEAFTTVFAKGLGNTGLAVSDFFESIMSSEGTIEGLDAGFKLLDGTIIATGNILEILSKGFHESLIVGTDVTGTMRDISNWITKIGSAGLLSEGPIGKGFNFMNQALADTEKVGWGAQDALTAVDKILRDSPEQTTSYADAMKKLNDEFERGIGLQASLLGDNISFQEALDNVTQSVQQNGTSLDITTEAGRANARALEQLAESARRVRQDNIDLGMSIQDANAQFANNKQAIYDAGTAAGFTRDQIEQLIGSLLRLSTIGVMGNRVTFGQSNSTFGGGLQEFGDGGVVQGPMGSAQLIMAHAGERVLTPAQQAYATGATGGGGTQTVRLEVVGSPSGMWDAMFIAWLQKYVRINGGTAGVLGIVN